MGREKETAGSTARALGVVLRDMEWVALLEDGTFREATGAEIARGRNLNNAAGRVAELLKGRAGLLAAVRRVRKALNQNPEAAEDALRDDPKAWGALRDAANNAEEG